jgi:hypothetical protein
MTRTNASFHLNMLLGIASAASDVLALLKTQARTKEDEAEVQLM